MGKSPPKRKPPTLSPVAHTILTSSEAVQAVRFVIGSHSRPPSLFIEVDDALAAEFARLSGGVSFGSSDNLHRGHVLSVADKLLGENTLKQLYKAGFDRLNVPNVVMLGSDANAEITRRLAMRTCPQDSFLHFYASSIRYTRDNPVA